MAIYSKFEKVGGLYLWLAMSGLLTMSHGAVANSTGEVSANIQPVIELSAKQQDSVTSPTSEFDPHWHDRGVYTNAAVCATCHRASTDGSGIMRMPPSATGTDVSPDKGWRYSMMAHAWNDPYFQATVEDQASRFPAYAGDIEDKCLTCHAPMGQDYAHDSGRGLTTVDCSLVDGCYRMDQALTDDHAREGVSCTLCHQMTGQPDAPDSGNFNIPGEGDPGARTIYGPYRGVFTRPMRNATGYAVRQSAYISSSEHCASCHDLSTQAFDANTGHPAEPAISFKEQAPYAEWRNSRYGDGGPDHRSCQDCHMAGPEDYATAIAVTRSGMAHPRWPQRSPFAPHTIAGGNTYVLGLLKQWREELGIARSTTEQGFEDAIAQGREFLQQAADIAIDCQSRDARELHLCVTITNRTGHKLPTGYPSRRMWLHLVVIDADGQKVFESGRPDKRGYLALDGQHLAAACLKTEPGQNGANEDCLEPHRDVISRPEQVAIYEAVMADSNERITYALLYAAGYLKDNRIPPAGFSSLGRHYDASTQVIGKAAVDRDFNIADGAQGSGSDTVRYRIALPEGLEGKLRVKARLWYQSIRPAFVHALSAENRKAAHLQTMYRERPPRPELLAVAKKTVK